MPNVSIIVPLYNKELAVRDTIESILKQSYKDFELIIVDDGSTDSSLSIIKTFDDRRIRIYSKQNGGVSSARNYGIEKVKGEWIYFFDADDLMADDALLTMMRMIRNFPNNKVFVGNVWMPSSDRYSLLCHQFTELARESKNPYKDFYLNRFAPATGSYLFSKKIIPIIGVFNEQLSFFEDFDFTTRMMSNYSFVYTSIPMKYYRLEFSNLSGCNHAIEKEFAYYLTKEQIRGDLWKQLVFASNVRYTEYIRAMAKDEFGVSYYKQLYSKNFTLYCKIINFMQDQIKRIKNRIIKVNSIY